MSKKIETINNVTGAGAEDIDGKEMREKRERLGAELARALGSKEAERQVRRMSLEEVVRALDRIEDAAPTGRRERDEASDHDNFGLILMAIIIYRREQTRRLRAAWEKAPVDAKGKRGKRGERLIQDLHKMEDSCAKALNWARSVSFVNDLRGMTIGFTLKRECPAKRRCPSDAY